MSESSFRLSSGGSDQEDARPTRTSKTAGRKRSRSESTKRSRSRSAAPHAKRRGVRGVKKAYIDLLNQCIQDTIREDDDQEPLPASQIGASFWTSEEKSAFFHALQRVGPDDLPALAAAVLTKSQPEIHAYLRLLQAGVLESENNLTVKDSFNLGDVPPATEVSPLCEDALNGIADGLSLKVEEREQRLLQEKYGPDWLIDGATAERLEDEYVEPPEDDEEDTQTTPAIPAAHLLRPTAFLRLSDSIFMNGPLGTEGNWTEYDSDNGPAMYRDALEDFYSLTTTMTKRLVQISLFQAMSRIRAMDADRSHPYAPQLRVTNVDVRTASGMMGLKMDRTSYWAKLPRKFGLQVYSESKKYNDGRAGTKNGWQLTYDEAETELDFPPPVVEERQLSDFEADSDDLSNDDENASEMSETDYLELLDQRNSREEEQKLWFLAERSRRSTLDEPKLPPRPGTTKEDRPPSWRERLKYDPEWNHLDSRVQDADFSELHLHGQRKRAVREASQVHSRPVVVKEEKPRRRVGSLNAWVSEDEDDDEEPEPLKHDN